MIDEKSKEFQFADDILLKVSRTFALNINVLSGRLKQSVLLAYLCLRIADTVEDDPQMTASEKKRLLDAFSNIFANYDKHLVKEFTDALPVEWLSLKIQITSFVEKQPPLSASARNSLKNTKVPFLQWWWK